MRKQQTANSKCQQLPGLAFRKEAGNSNNFNSQQNSLSFITAPPDSTLAVTHLKRSMCTAEIRPEGVKSDILLSLSLSLSLQHFVHTHMSTVNRP
jgi:hypothetical protein